MVVNNPNVEHEMHLPRTNDHAVAQYRVVVLEAVVLEVPDESSMERHTTTKWRGRKQRRTTDRQSTFQRESVVSMFTKKFTKSFHDDEARRARTQLSVGGMFSQLVQQPGL